MEIVPPWLPIVLVLVGGQVGRVLVKDIDTFILVPVTAWIIKVKVGSRLFAFDRESSGVPARRNVWRD